MTLGVSRARLSKSGVGSVFCAARDGGHANPKQARSVRRVVVTAAVHVARARGGHDGVLGVVSDGDEVIMFHSRSLTRQSVAASNIDTADEAIQNVIAGPKSYVRTPSTTRMPDSISDPLMFSCTAAPR